MASNHVAGSAFRDGEDDEDDKDEDEDGEEEEAVDAVIVDMVAVEGLILCCAPNHAPTTGQETKVTIRHVLRPGFAMATTLQPDAGAMAEKGGWKVKDLEDDSRKSSLSN